MLAPEERNRNAVPRLRPGDGGGNRRMSTNVRGAFAIGEIAVGGASHTSASTTSTLQIRCFRSARAMYSPQEAAGGAAA